MKERGDKNNPEIKKQKEIVLQKLKKIMHISPDRPKQGFGSTTDGNTARRFFSNPSAAAKATGIDHDIIKMFGVILFVLSSGHEVNVEHFESYCKTSLLCYKKLYSWYPLTPTVHKVLEHSSAVLKHFLLPMGQLSEEAQEARNKDIRNYREFFSRKSSRRLNINDLFCRLLLSSDPVISSARELPRKSTHKLAPEIKKDLQTLLISSQFHESLEENSAVSDDSNDEELSSEGRSDASDELL